MTAVGFLLTLARLGVQLEAAGHDLRYRARAGVVTQDIKAEITKQKLVLLEVLADPRRVAQEAWAETVEDISKLWSDYKIRKGEAPWLEEQVDADLQAELADALRVGNLPRALVAIESWRVAWVTLLNPTDPTTSEYPGTAGDASTSPDSPPSPGNPTNPTSDREPGDEGDQDACDPDLERQGTPSKNPTNPTRDGGTGATGDSGTCDVDPRQAGLLSNDPTNPTSVLAVGTAGCLDTVATSHESGVPSNDPTNPTRDERVFPGTSPEAPRLDPGHRGWLEKKAARSSGVELFDSAEDPGRGEEEREIFRAEILARADLITAESEGRRPPPNPSVHRMFAEARARPGSRDVAERSITAWLGRHAAEVAEKWPEAALDAAWLQWRRHVGPEHVGFLDQAWQAINAKGAEKR